jgi:hypothetical protein
MIPKLITPLLVLAVSAAAARADELPAAMDFIPIDAQAAVVIPSLQRLDEHSAELMGTIELTTIGSIGQMLRVLGPKDSLDLDGSAAIVMPILSRPEGDPDDEPVDAVVIIPTTSFDTFIDRIGASPQGDLHTFDYAGNPFYAAPLDNNFVALSGDAEMVRACKPLRNLRAQHATELGAGDVRMIATCDVAVVASGAGIEPVLELMLQPFVQTAVAVGLLTPQGGSAQARAIDQLKNTLSTRSHRSVVAITAGAMGLQIDASAKLEGMPVVEGEHAHTEPSPLDLAPDAPFIFAASTRFDHPMIRAAIAAAVEGAGPGLNAEQSPVARAVLGALSQTDGASLVVYEPTEPLIIAGAFSNTVVQWQGKDPAEAGRAIRSVIEGLNGKQAGSGKLGVAYAPGNAVIGEMKMDKWSVSGVQMNMMFFGAQPLPQGYLAIDGARGFLSLGPNANMLSAAAAMTAEKQSLTDNVYLRQLRRFLLERPAAEWYLNLQPALKQFGPMLQMAVPGLEIPASLPPIAGAMDIKGDTVRITIFTPAPVLKLTVPMYRTLTRSPQANGGAR